MKKHLKTPLKEEDVKALKVEDIVFLSGTVLTARDKAHKRIIEYVQEERKLPFDIEGSVVYHCGPLVKERDRGWEVVSAGPTTSARMNAQTPEVIEKFNLRAVVGKGGMSKEVSDALSRSGCVYLAFTGGAGALAADKISKVIDVFWLDLNPLEAVWVLSVKNFGPLVVAMDASGGNLYSV